MFALLWRALTGLALAAAACGAFAAESNVPYVPTPQEVVDKMLAMARVTPNDYLIDLGSGDGRIVVTAVRKYGARGFGVDLNPQRIREAVENALQNGVSDRTAFYQHMLGLMRRFDVLVLPSCQVWPFDAALRWPQQIQTPKGTVQMDTYHRWMEVVLYASLAGLPALNVPCGFNDQGLPMGMQLIGQPQGELALLALGLAYEEVVGDWLAIRSGQLP